MECVRGAEHFQPLAPVLRLSDMALAAVVTSKRLSKSLFLSSLPRTRTYALVPTSAHVTGRNSAFALNRQPTC
jgi:hypothetical protein